MIKYDGWKKSTRNRLEMHKNHFLLENPIFSIFCVFIIEIYYHF